MHTIYCFNNGGSPGPWASLLVHEDVALLGNLAAALTQPAATR